MQQIDEGIYRVTATVRNSGFQPTELAVRENLGRATPVIASITLSDNANLLDEKASHHLGVIRGNQSKQVSWLVKAATGSQATLEASHPKGGTATVSVTF